MWLKRGLWKSLFAGLASLQAVCISLEKRAIIMKHRVYTFYLVRRLGSRFLYSNMTHVQILLPIQTKSICFCSTEPLSPPYSCFTLGTATDFSLHLPWQLFPITYQNGSYHVCHLSSFTSSLRTIPMPASPLEPSRAPHYLHHMLRKHGAKHGAKTCMGSYMIYPVHLFNLSENNSNSPLSETECCYNQSKQIKVLPRNGLMDGLNL